MADPLVLPLHQPRPPLRGPEVPAVLPRLAAAAGLAQASPRPPAHVGPQPRLLPVQSSVLAVCHVHPGQAFHERPGLQQPGGRVLHNPHERVKVRNDLKGAEHQRVALQEPPRARRQRAAVFRADRAGPDHVEVPRERRVVPAPDVAEDGGLKFRHDVQGDDLPARRLEGPAHRLCAAEKLQESRHF